MSNPFYSKQHQQQQQQHQQATKQATDAPKLFLRTLWLKTGIQVAQNDPKANAHHHNRVLAHFESSTPFYGRFGYPVLVQAIEKLDEARVLGPAPLKESVGDMQYKYYKEFMEWLTDPLTKKGYGEDGELQTEGVPTPTGDHHPCVPPKSANP